GPHRAFLAVAAWLEWVRQSAPRPHLRAPLLVDHSPDNQLGHSMARVRPRRLALSGYPKTDRSLVLACELSWNSPHAHHPGLPGLPGAMAYPERPQPPTDLAGWRGCAGHIDCHHHRGDGRSPDAAIPPRAKSDTAGDSTRIMVGFAPSELLWRGALLVGIVSLRTAGLSKLLVGHRRPNCHAAALPGRQHSPDRTPPAGTTPYLYSVPATGVTVFPLVFELKEQRC